MLTAVFEVKERIPDEANCFTRAAGRLECFRVDTGSSSRYRCRGICAAVREGEQKGRQGTAESMEEIREGAEAGDQEVESSH
jgi:hypothetical protein